MKFLRNIKKSFHGNNLVDSYDLNTIDEKFLVTNTQVDNVKIILFVDATRELSLAIGLCKIGYKVFGLCNQKDYKNLPIEINWIIIENRDVFSAIEKWQLEQKSFDVIIFSQRNNIFCSALEECSLNEFRDNFESNFIYIKQILDQTLPMIRNNNNKGGSVIFLGSIFLTPCLSVEQIGQHMVKNFMEMLSYELMQFNINVKFLDFLPNFNSNAKMSDHLMIEYSRERQQSVKIRKKFLSNIKDEVILKQFTKIFHGKESKFYISMGLKLKYLIFIKLMLPHKIFQKLIFKNHK